VGSVFWIIISFLDKSPSTQPYASWYGLSLMDGVIFLFRKTYFIIREQEKGGLVVVAFVLNFQPDLNAINNLWEHLKREKVKHNPTSKDNQPMGCR
jgi:hypothetical protein